VRDLTQCPPVVVHHDNDAIMNDIEAEGRPNVSAAHAHANGDAIEEDVNDICSPQSCFNGWPKAAGWRLKLEKMFVFADHVAAQQYYSARAAFLVRILILLLSMMYSCDVINVAIGEPSCA
jgi:hypothetical protein